MLCLCRKINSSTSEEENEEKKIFSCLRRKLFCVVFALTLASFSSRKNSSCAKRPDTCIVASLRSPFLPQRQSWKSFCLTDAIAWSSKYASWNHKCERWTLNFFKGWRSSLKVKHHSVEHFNFASKTFIASAHLLFIAGLEKHYVSATTLLLFSLVFHEIMSYLKLMYCESSSFSSFALWVMFTKVYLLLPWNMKPRQSPRFSQMQTSARKVSPKFEFSTFEGGKQKNPSQEAIIIMA